MLSEDTSCQNLKPWWQLSSVYHWSSNESCFWISKVMDSHVPGWYCIQVCVLNNNEKFSTFTLCVSLFIWTVFVTHPYPPTLTTYFFLFFFHYIYSFFTSQLRNTCTFFMATICYHIVFFKFWTISYFGDVTVPGRHFYCCFSVNWGHIDYICFVKKWIEAILCPESKRVCSHSFMSQVWFSNKYAFDALTSPTWRFNCNDASWYFKPEQLISADYNIW